MEYHTKNPNIVTKHNFSQGYLDYDISRQIELESYGYRTAVFRSTGLQIRVKNGLNRTRRKNDHDTFNDIKNGTETAGGKTCVVKTEYKLYQLDKTGYRGHQFGVMNVLHERLLGPT